MTRKILFAGHWTEVKSEHCSLLFLVVLSCVGNVDLFQRLSSLLSMAVLTGQAVCDVRRAKASFRKHLK